MHPALLLAFLHVLAPVGALSSFRFHKYDRFSSDIDLQRISDFYFSEFSADEFDPEAWVEETRAKLDFTSALFTAENQDGSIFGAAQITLHSSSRHPWSLIENVCVARRCRRRGLGRELMQSECSRTHCSL